ncbi:hypothetical protein SAMN05216567_12510 [Variovorax sp. OK605]|nr:hypothetical protein SAMN05216567_12510 [Variovorax sp. OK605]
MSLLFFSLPFRGRVGVGARGARCGAAVWRGPSCPHPSLPPGGEGAMHRGPALRALYFSLPFRGRVGVGACGARWGAAVCRGPSCPHPSLPPGGEGAMHRGPALRALYFSLPFRGRVGVGACGARWGAAVWRGPSCPHPSLPPEGEGAMLRGEWRHGVSAPRPGTPGSRLRCCALRPACRRRSSCRSPAPPRGRRCPSPRPCRARSARWSRRTRRSRRG